MLEQDGRGDQQPARPQTRQSQKGKEKRPKQIPMRKGMEERAKNSLWLLIATPNGAFRRIDVFVSAAAEESRALARLTGFLVQPQ